MRKVHWISVHPTHYNDYLFRIISADPAIDLTVHYMQGELSTHPWSEMLGQGFDSRVFRHEGVFDAEILRRAWCEPDSYFVVSGWRLPPLMYLLFAILIVRRRKFAIWTDTPALDRRRPFLKRVLRRFFLSMLFSSADRVMGTGKPGVKGFARMGCPPQKLVDLPFATDISFFKPSAKSHSKPVVLLSCGRLDNSHKGFHLAIEALSLVRRRGWSFRYRIAGTGPDEGTLRDLVKSCSLEGCVEFVGWLDPHELPGFYGSGDVFIHPSYFDPFPNAVLEAMASGLPVIGSSEAGSVRDRVIHGENGLIHKAGDMLDLARQIERMLTIEDIGRMGQRARETALQWDDQYFRRTLRQVLLADQPGDVADVVLDD